LEGGHVIIFPNGNIITDIVASCFLGYYGEGVLPFIYYPSYRKTRQLILRRWITNIGKSSTPSKKQGYVTHYDPRRPWTIFQWAYTAQKYIKKLPDGGKLNAYGLTNDGTEEVARRSLEYFDMGFNNILSIYPEFFGKTQEEAINETLGAIERCEHILGRYYFWAVQLSFGCHNSKEDISCNMKDSLALTEAVRKKFPWLVIIVKSSIVHPYEYLVEMQKYVDAFELVNTIPFDLVFPGQKSPIPAKGGGGYSGPASKEMVLKYLTGARKVLSKDIIMENSIRDLEDIKRYRGIGADAIAFCSVGTDNPNKAADFIEICS
jgi:dihydroorotate dehydrogenase (NAD+) catalytic subunit